MFRYIYSLTARDLQARLPRRNEAKKGVSEQCQAQPRRFPKENVLRNCKREHERWEGYGTEMRARHGTRKEGEATGPGRPFRPRVGAQAESGSASAETPGGSSRGTSSFFSPRQTL
ncbi:hypothetical protein HPB50_012271 [Hyalomma asiaticum]|uniref:Uncharacterized protein n=1 Tax=Hyalomma asiaticum TaxID=266040 RepID=A0ACB7S917_HYAAI|nr:hypothetical protein HPB50_012271 [Hyalomma asiaticum]